MVEGESACRRPRLTSRCHSRVATAGIDAAALVNPIGPSRPSHNRRLPVHLKARTVKTARQARKSSPNLASSCPRSSLHLLQYKHHHSPCRVQRASNAALQQPIPLPVPLMNHAEATVENVLAVRRLKSVRQTHTDQSLALLLGLAVDHRA